MIIGEAFAEDGFEAIVAMGCNGEVLCAHRDCMAGLGECCSHVGQYMQHNIIIHNESVYLLALYWPLV